VPERYYSVKNERKEQHTRRSIEQDTLGRLNAQIDKSITMGHRKDDRLNQLLDLLVQTADVAVLLSRALIDLHNKVIRVTAEISAVHHTNQSFH
jgi:hypothetical protein